MQRSFACCQFASQAAGCAQGDRPLSFWLILMPDVPLFAQVFPLRIHGYDQGNLLDPTQAFDLLLAGDGNMNLNQTFEVD